jgi:hypothetical protein
MKLPRISRRPVQAPAESDPMIRFKCTSCDEWHEGTPSYSADAPLYYHSIPLDARAKRCALGTDTCVVDQKSFFVRGCLEIPVHGESEPFIWGVWVSLSKNSFDQFIGCFGAPKRSHIRPFFGWLSAELPLYPSTENLKTRLHLRDNGVRPYIELESTDHPLALEQRRGVSAERLSEIYSHLEHREQQGTGGMDLDDPGWTRLHGGYHIPYDPREALRALERGERPTIAWRELWNELYHQGDVGEASYAVVPHLVRIHAARRTCDWNTYALVAMIDEARRDGRNPELPAALRAAYEAAWSQLVQLGLRELGAAEDPTLVSCIISVLAIGKGQLTLGRLAVMFTEDERKQILAEGGLL